MGKKSFAHLTAKDAMFFLGLWMSGGLERRDITWHLDVENLLLGWDIIDRWRQVERYDDGWFNHIQHITDIELGTLHELSLTFERAGMTGDQMREYLRRDIFCPKLRAHIRAEADLAPVLTINTNALYERSPVNFFVEEQIGAGTIPLRANSFRYITLHNSKFCLHVDDYFENKPGWEEHNYAAQSRLRNWIQKRKLKFVNSHVADALFKHKIRPRCLQNKRAVWAGITYKYRECPFTHHFHTSWKEQPNDFSSYWSDDYVEPLHLLPYHVKTDNSQTDCNFNMTFVCYAPHLLQ